MDIDTAVNRITRELDSVVNEIQDVKAPPRDVVGVPDLDYRPKLRGKALGLAMALAVITGRKVDEERQLAYERWEVRQYS